MKRILITLAFCSPLFFSTSAVHSIELIGPNGETQVSSEQYGPIPATETLWAISTKLKPDNSVSVYQTLVAIYKLNPTAFNKGNINGIIPNSVLNVPSVEFIAQQTNKEAYDLLKPSSKKQVIDAKKAVVIKEVSPAVTPEVKPQPPAVDPEVLNTLKKEIADRDTALTTSDQLISEQEKELLLLNEQLLVLTEKHQVLKLKLQPLSDQISMLDEQVEQEISIQKELQALIDQYKAQIDSFVEPPFSGDGLINEIFRTITSSITSVLIAILLPLLLLGAIIVLMSRLKSKRELAIQEQEMAESTAILMEQQSGKFDSLLTDDLEGDESSDDNIDFANPTSNENEVENDSIIDEPTEVNIEQSDDDFSLDIIEDDSEAISLDEEVIPPKEDFEDLVATEDDPFGIGALVEEEDLVVELDSEGETGAEGDNDESFDIDALIAGNEETIELSDDDLSASEESNQADLDLAAEWESQLASESEDDVAVELSEEEGETPTDTNEDDEQETADELAELETLLGTESSEEDIDSLLEEDAPSESDNVESILETAAQTENEAETLTDLDAILDTETALEVSDEVENDAEVIDDLDAILDTEMALEVSDEVENDAEEVADIDTTLAADTELEVSDEVENDTEEITDLDAILDTETVLEVSDEVDNDAEEVADIDMTLAADAVLEASDEVDNDAEKIVDLDAILAAETALEVPDEVDNDAETVLEIPDEAENVAEEIADFDAILEAELEDSEEVIETEESASVEEVTDLSEFENIDISTLKNVDEAISALDEAENTAELDTLAQQLSEGAFNEDVPLPSIDKIEDDGFIDIESLLEDTNSEEVIEDEFNLELGLEEFPDVVESFSEYDTDDTGIAAQLDLARAYLEIDEKNGAKEILTALLETAKEEQLKEVEKLLNKI